MTPHYECAASGSYYPASEMRWYQQEVWSIEHLRRHGIDPSPLPRFDPEWERLLHDWRWAWHDGLDPDGDLLADTDALLDGEPTEESPPHEARSNCGCDRCFYGRDRLALRIAELEARLAEAREALLAFVNNSSVQVGFPHECEAAEAALAGQGGDNA